MAAELPAWVRELDLAPPLSPQILITGNVRDLYLLPPEDRQAASPTPADQAGEPEQYDIVQVIARICSRRSYRATVVHDVAGGSAQEWRNASRQGTECAGRIVIPADPSFGQREALPEGVRGMLGHELDVRSIRGALTEMVRHRGAPVAMIFPYAARLATLAKGTPDGVAFLTAAEALGHSATRVQGLGAATVYNTIFWIADRQEDLPAAFTTGSQALRIITIPEPSPDTRLAAARFYIELLGPDSQVGAAKLAAATYGMRVADVDAICRMAADLGTPAGEVDEAARQYRVGVVENPWATEALIERVRNAERELNDRVLGQRGAVRKTLDILMRSVTGLTGAQASSSPNRPRGVLFLAGPTGVGKTELAKALAAMIQNDKDAQPIRFDMSEFGAEHARQRLIGAPPGYVGYDSGGELVSAVRAHPVSVLLFDEIDKAHPLILDLFLQILEDGRLTDGRGATVYFTECLLVFTSNLGVIKRDKDGNVDRLSRLATPADVEERLRESFTNFFDTVISRPELRNRFGDNFVVMDFIREDTLPLILDKAIQSVARRVAQTQDRARLEISPDARAYLERQALGMLDHGGRGVNNTVEALLVNPLARELFVRKEELTGQKITVLEFTSDADGPGIRVSPS